MIITTNATATEFGQSYPCVDPTHVGEAAARVSSSAARLRLLGSR
ncbi:MAG: hypothetical protein Q4G43_03760 [Mobilicoccus sp.]|nr:hypothetical protein [Mobilicoccus sp.]